ncbi:nuclear transport factor 2 family protein [Gemmatimonadota bacterium]
MKLVRLAALLMVVVVSGTASAQSDTDMAAEREVVTRAVLEYMDGGMAGDADRVAAVLHQEFHSARPSSVQQTGRQFLNSYGITFQIEATRARGETAGEADRDIEITILGVGFDLATVRAVSSASFEYIQLAKIGGEWKIINVLWVPVQTPGDTGDLSERDQVEAAALDYIDGAYSGDADRMARALASDFNKVVPFTIPATGGTLLSHSTVSQLVEGTDAKLMVLDVDQRNINLTIQDADRGIASVWIVSAMYIDLLQIAKINDEWKIVNVLWLPNPDAPGRGA